MELTADTIEERIQQYGQIMADRALAQAIDEAHEDDPEPFDEMDDWTPRN